MMSQCPGDESGSLLTTHPSVRSGLPSNFFPGKTDIVLLSGVR